MGTSRHVALLVVLAVAAALSAGCRASPPESENIELTPTSLNPLGAKGVGEAGTLGSSPSIAAAAVDALSECGVKHIDMMLRPEKLWRIIQGGQAPSITPRPPRRS